MHSCVHTHRYSYVPSHSFLMDSLMANMKSYHLLEFIKVMLITTVAPTALFIIQGNGRQPIIKQIDNCTVSQAWGT